jgi:hypothetical protein
MLWTIGDPRASRRIDSWKEIASFFRRDERTVKRWEKSKFLPVHRIPGSERGGVFAYTHELTEWLNTPLPAKGLQTRPVRSRLDAVAVRVKPARRAKLIVQKSKGSPAWQAPTVPTSAAEMVAGTEKSCSIYKKRHDGDKVSYSLVRQAELFGWSTTWNRGGWLPHLLHEHMKAKPLRTGSAWHITRGQIRAALEGEANAAENSALLIKIRPDKASSLLAEIVEVWGYSFNGWTSMMLRLQHLVSGNPGTADPVFFSIENRCRQARRSIFMMTCTPDGSIEGGSVIGKWPQATTGPVSSVVLWPQAFAYFANEAKKILATC